MKYLFNLVLIVFSLFFVISYNISADELCMECHSDQDISMEKNDKVISLYVNANILKQSPHSALKCVDCHAGFDPDEFPHKENIQPIDCKSCHKDVVSLHPFHASMKNQSSENYATLNDCKACHGTHNVISPKSIDSPMHESKSVAYCGHCHEDVAKAHGISEHKSLAESNRAPTCITCHRKPITSASESITIKLKQNQEKLCISCHIKSENQTTFSKSLVNYEKSVHGSQLMSGNQNAATCIDCHGTHDLQKASSPTSTVNKLNISKVCGKCHISTAHEYEMSIHGKALANGNEDSPSCTFCHGEHDIAKIPEITPAVFSANHINKTTFIENQMVYCVVCHVDKAMMDKYNVSTVEKAHEWLPKMSIHWETVRCIDCHSSFSPPHMSHDILPPEKTVQKCEECHSKNSILMTKLYKHEKERSREKFGFINGTILSDAYVVGTTRNLILDTGFIMLLSITAIFILLHSFLRWYFKRTGKK